MNIFITGVSNCTSSCQLLEYISIASDESMPVKLSNWKITDRVRHKYVFPEVTINPGMIIKIWSGSGINDNENLYMGRKRAIWNNNGDTATLTDATGKVIDVFHYTKKSQQLPIPDFRRFGPVVENGKVLVTNGDTDPRNEILYYNRKNMTFWLGNPMRCSLNWSLVNECHGFDDLFRSDVRLWVGKFHDYATDQILFYCSTSHDWFLGFFKAEKFVWAKVANTEDEYGDLLRSQVRMWTGKFANEYLESVLFYNSTDGTWYLGMCEALGRTMHWTYAGEVRALGNLLENGAQFWMGNYLNEKQTSFIIYTPQDYKFHRLSIYNGKLIYNYLTDTGSIGNVLSAGFRIWTGNFRTPGIQDILIYDKKMDMWYLSNFNNAERSLQCLGRIETIGFGQVAEYVIFEGKFSGTSDGITSPDVGKGTTDLLMYGRDTGWWFLTTFENGVLHCTAVMNTSQLFFDTTSLSNVPPMVLDFNGNGRESLVIHEPSIHLWRVFTVTGTGENSKLRSYSCTSPFKVDQRSIITKGRFIDVDSSQLLFYHGDTGVWYFGTMRDSVLEWRIASMTYLFREAPEKSIIDSITSVFSSIVDIGIDITMAITDFFGITDTIVSIMNSVVFLGGFKFDQNQRIFYSLQDPWQRNFGYFSLYDTGAKYINFNIHCEEIKFFYDDKHWKIELWKGQYGLSTGAEIGIYVGEYNVDTGLSPLDHTLNWIDFGNDNNCAPDEYMMNMSFVLRKNGKTLFTREANDDPAWWLTGFKPGEHSLPNELLMELAITFFTDKMAAEFVKSLKLLGYQDSVIVVSGRKVSFVFSIPYMKKP